MRASCSIYPHARNSKGEVVESKLFKDLLHYTSNNRTIAKEYYAVGTNQKFLDKVGNKAKFDENGEITFQSLRKLAKLNIKEEELLQTLNKDIKAGTYEYQDAIGILQSFNRGSQFNNDYLATIKSNGTGKYQLSIVKKTSANVAALNKEISNRSLQDRILYYLNKAGVDISFISSDEKIDGRYSTKNAKKTANGLYALIQVAHGEKVTQTMAEEAGHFAVGALGNSPLVSRLESILDPEVQKQILGDEEYESKALGESSRREVAGYLVGKAIAGEIDKRASWQNLVNRIVDAAKRIFYTINGDEIKKAALEADHIAEQIAMGFMSSNFEGTVENAISREEELYSAPVSFNVRVYKEILNRLKLQAAQVRRINDKVYKKYANIIAKVESGRDVSKPSILSDSRALEGITEAVSLIADMLQQEIPSKLDSVNFNNDVDFYGNMPRNAKALREVHTFVQNTIAISEIISEALSVLPGKETFTGDIHRILLADSFGNAINYDLKKLSDRLAELGAKKADSLYNQLITKEGQFFLRFLTEINGDDSIIRSARIVFNKNFKSLKDLVIKREREKIDLATIMTALDSDISLFERYFASMSNSSDIIGQLADRTTKLANKMADDLTNQDHDRLRILQQKLSDLGQKNTDIFCERSERTGKITGNIVSELCWGDYEDDWAAFKKKCIEDFKIANPNIDNWSDFEKTLLWQAFFDPLQRDWHKTHSQWNDQMGMWFPSKTIYKSNQYNKLINEKHELISWLNEYMSLKLDIDSRLPEGSAYPYRMPQFRGSFSNRVRNRKLFENTGKAVRGTMRATLREEFLEDSEDTEFGSQQTFNTLDEDIFSNQLFYEKEQLNRVPLYGINKLRDIENISTDLFYTTLAYSGMANTNKAMNEVVDTLEVGSEVLNRRKVGGTTTEQEGKKDKSRAYNRYLKFLDKQVYGIGTKKIKIGDKLVLNKLANICSGFAAKWFLGGNVAGGMVNLGTGITEIFKEGLAGQYFDMKDLKAAHALYVKGMVPTLWQSGKTFKDNKLSMFMRHFNALNENRQNQRDWKTRKSRLHNIYDDSWFFPYKAGDHYMQSISYLALAKKTKLYDGFGHAISLWDAYEYTEEDGIMTFKLRLNKYAKKKEDVPTIKTISSIIDQIDSVLNASIATSPFGTVLNLSQAEKDYLSANGYNIANMEDTKAKLQMALNTMIWTVDDESQFMDKAREVNNRMHGIYNQQDKVTMQQNIMGNMWLAMKGYALGMIERRFGSSKYNEVLGTDVEGSIRTMAKIIASTFTDAGGFKLTMRALFLPVVGGKKTQQQMLNMGFSESQYRNMRRNFGDACMILMYSLLALMTAKPKGDDDDDEEDITTGICYYFASRLLREQNAFNFGIPAYVVKKIEGGKISGPLETMKQEATQLLDIVPSGFTALGDLMNIVHLAIGSLDGDLEDSEYFYQSSKEGVYEEGDPKWVRKAVQRIPYYRSMYVFENPYDAAKSFEYGRKIRN